MPSSSSCPCASAPFRRNSCAIRALSTASPAPAPRGCSSIVWNVSARGSRTGSGRARRHQRQLRASTERAPVGFDRPFGRARGRAAECATARDAAATHSDDRLPRRPRRAGGRHPAAGAPRGLGGGGGPQGGGGGARGGFLGGAGKKKPPFYLPGAGK